MSDFFLILGSLSFGAKRLLRYLRFFQQENYNFFRFLKWVVKTRSFDTKGSLIALIASLIALNFPFLANVFGGIALIVLTFFEEDPRKTGKLSLKMTERAKRIFVVSFAAYALIVLISTYSSQKILVWLFQAMIFQMIPFWLLIGCSLLSKEERKRQRRYLREARECVMQVDPFIIGITGSYGKTSTKEALVQILQVTLGPTFSPLKGVNTMMGITKEIRTKLRKGYRYAVIEMGAYKQGSIKELCGLTPPHAAIITGIGTAHLERFGNVETIRKAKGELAQAVLEEGILVCNGDNPGSRRIANEIKKTIFLYGQDEQYGTLDCWISHTETTLKGTHFKIKWKGKIFNGFTPLLGKSSLSNIAAVFTMACALGSQPEYVLAAIANLEVVDNRLQIQKERDAIFLRDAYNSNPLGFTSALEVMGNLPGKKRILMTPGIIELGEKQYVENEKIGRKAATICDLALIVNEENKKALEDGLRAGGMSDEKILYCATRKEAFDKLNHHLEKDDIVLIENDLPDLYEIQTKF